MSAHSAQSKTARIREIGAGGLSVTIIIILVNLSSRALFTLSASGRIAQRIGRLPALRPAAVRFADLHYSSSKLTGSTAALSIYEIVSVIEELARTLSGEPTKTLGGLLKSSTSLTQITPHIRDEMTSLYILRNRIPGAGHGVAAIDLAEAREVVKRGTRVIEELVLIAESKVERASQLTGWSAAMGW